MGYIKIEILGMITLLISIAIVILGMILDKQKNTNNQVSVLIF